MIRSSDIEISIIIPVYNSGKMVARCIDSVLAQIVPVPWEMILINDGSTDDSGRICDEYASRYLCIRVFHTENQGASLARRLGIEKAAGEYISFVDSDDFVSSDYLSALYDMEMQFKLGVSACGVVRMMPGEHMELKPRNDVPIILEGNELFHRFFKYEFWGLCGKLFRKELFQDVKFPEPTICEDYNVMAQVLHKVGRMAYSSTPLYYYEQHKDSLSHQPISKRAFEEFSNTRDVYLYVSKEMPEYKANALANAVGSAVKLLLASRMQSGDFGLQRMELACFLASHRKEILSCRQLNRKTMLLAIALSYAGKSN